MVEAVQRYVLLPEERARLSPLFGLILSTLYDLDLTSDTAISEWFEAASESTDPAVDALLRQKWTQWLIERLDDDDEEEGEESEGDREEED